MKLVIISKGCPLCEGELKGNYEYGLYCKKCNVLFRPEHIGISKSMLDRMSRKIEVVEAFKVPKNAAVSTAKIEDFGLELTKEKGRDVVEEYKEPAVHHLAQPKKEIIAQFNVIASRNSTKVHLSNCFFAKNIKEDNKIIFNSLDDAVKNGYKFCSCIKS